MLARRLVVAAMLLAATQLTGCFFIFIPGSVVGAVSDSITGAAGANCVSSGAKVGENVRMADGSLKQVKSLSGTSTRCADANLPIRAELVDMPASVPTSTPQLANVSIELPPGWDRQPLSQTMIAQGGKVYATHASGSFMAMYMGTRSQIVDASAFATSRRADQLSRVKDGIASTIVHTTEAGARDVYRFEVVGLAVNGQRVAYVMTVIATDRAVILVNPSMGRWSSAAARRPAPIAVCRGPP